MSQEIEIRIEGWLGSQWADWFDGLAITLTADGQTLLSGPVADQPALYGYLKKVRDLGLPLVSVNPMDSVQPLLPASNAQKTDSLKEFDQMKKTVSTEYPSLRGAALTAGFGLLVMFFAAMFANFFVISGMIVPTSAETTTNNILANLPLFRSGVVSFLLVLICDVLAAWGLYVVFQPASPQLSKLAAWFRLVYTAIFGAALLGLVAIPSLLGNAQWMATFEPAQLQSQVLLFFRMFDSAWTFSLVFFGVHLLVLGYLVFRSGYAPKWIGILLVLAAFGYLTDNVAKLLMSNYADYASVFLPMVVIPGILGELSLCFWLLFKGGKDQ